MRGCTPWKMQRGPRAIIPRRTRTCGGIVLADVENVGRGRYRWDVYERQGGGGTTFGPWKPFSGGEESSLAAAKRAADRMIEWWNKVH